MTWVRILIALPLGLVFGSFFTVAIYRIPSGESIVAPRSRCPSCGTQIGARDNVPVLSWILLRGKCRHCGARISVVYPLTELATGLLFVAVALTFEDVWVAALMAPFLGLLFALAVIDWRHKILPNRLVYPAFAIALVYLIVAAIAGGGVDLATAAVGCLAYGGALLVIAVLSPRGMGMGDVKLCGLIGLVLGALGLEYVAVAAGAGILLGGVAAIGALIAGASRKKAIPFGPFLAAGAIVAAFWAPQISDAYLSLFT